MFERHDQVINHCGSPEPLYVITSVFNPIRYRTRWKLYEDFKAMVAMSGAILYTVEVAFGDRSFTITDPDNPLNLQLRTSHELWIKENALNLLMSRLPLDWKYVAWLDADITFVRPDWANETIHALQHYDVIQPWSESFDVSPSNTTLRQFRSFMWSLHNDIPPTLRRGYPLPQNYWHPGYAWAATRPAINSLGGLIDWAVLGGGDLLMARALANLNGKLPQSLGKSGQQFLKVWQDRATKHIRQNVGYIDGTILHHWHGHKVDRRYKDRGQILIDGQFDPITDLKRDWQGLYQLESDKPSLRDGIRKYFRERNEDAI